MSVYDHPSGEIGFEVREGAGVGAGMSRCRFSISFVVAGQVEFEPCDRLADEILPRFPKKTRL